jgi:hypothetical protein
MMRHPKGTLAALALMLSLSACERPNDPAVLIADALQSADKQLGRDEGARYTLVYPHVGARPLCRGKYRVQFNEVGALIAWCLDDSGNTIDSGSTTYHSNFADTARDFIVDLPDGAPLHIDLERRGDRALIVDVH